jgi:molybdenum cofactor guanylyltransferase
VVKSSNENLFITKKNVNVAGFVLAGGRSTRMGRDKALLDLGGVPLVMRMVQVAAKIVMPVSIVAPADRYAGLGVPLVADRWPGAGPLGGMATALASSDSDWNLILGCDLPYLTPEWIAWLIARAAETPAHAAVPESKHGLEPLAAVYHRSCAAALVSAVERGVRRVTEGLNELFFERIAASEWQEFDPRGILFANMNTPEDYAEARRRIEPPKL